MTDPAGTTTTDASADEHTHAASGCGGGCGGGGCGGHGGGGHAGGGCGGGGCGCGGHTAYVPTLDARTLDPMIRQSAIFGVLVGMPPQTSVTVLTEADPTSIADLLAERLPGEYEVATEKDDESYVVTFSRL